MANSECFVLPRPTTPPMRTLYGGSRNARSAAVRHQASDVGRRASIAAEQPVRAEHPQVATLADHRVLQPLGVDTVLRIGSVRFKIGHKLIDLGRLEAEDRDIKAFCFQQPGQLRYFYRETHPSARSPQSGCQQSQGHAVSRAKVLPAQ